MREFPEDAYLNDNNHNSTSIGTVSMEDYGFLKAMLPVGIVLILMILLFIFTRRNVCLLKSWIK